MPAYASVVAMSNPQTQDMALTFDSVFAGNPQSAAALAQQNAEKHFSEWTITQAEVKAVRHRLPARTARAGTAQPNVYASMLTFEQKLPFKTHPGLARVLWHENVRRAPTPEQLQGLPSVTRSKITSHVAVSKEAAEQQAIDKLTAEIGQVEITEKAAWQVSKRVLQEADHELAASLANVHRGRTVFKKLPILQVRDAAYDEPSADHVENVEDPFRYEPPEDITREHSSAAG